LFSGSDFPVMMYNKAHPMGYVESELLSSTQADANIGNKCAHVCSRVSCILQFQN
jgi:hypothetical protein